LSFLGVHRGIGGVSCSAIDSFVLSAPGRAKWWFAVVLICAAPVARSATLVVDTTNDGEFNGANTILSDGVCELREAIDNINNGINSVDCIAVGGPYGTNDTINFDIQPYGQLHVITLDGNNASGSLTVYKNLTINGYSQNGTQTNSAANGSNAHIGIALRGMNGAQYGLSFQGLNAQGSVRGLEISGFSGPGIRVQNGAHDVTIAGNFIGVQADGDTISSNSEGIALAGNPGALGAVMIGGVDVANRNVVAGNTSEIFIAYPGGSAISVMNNLIGVGADGLTKKAQAASTGIYLTSGASNVSVSGNIIGAGVTGIRSSSSSNGFEVSNNWIGVNGAGGSIAGAGDGVYIQHTSLKDINANAMIGLAPGGGNIIANWGRDGVRVEQGAGGIITGVSILGNSIYATAHQGINLIASTNPPINPDADINDAGDADTGPNGFQNYPVISKVASDGNSTGITFSFNSKADSAYRIAFYSNSSCKSEGQTYEGFIDNIMTDGAGNYSGSVNLPMGMSVGNYLTATAEGDEGASEFSACQQIVKAGTNLPPTATNDNYSVQAGQILTVSAATGLLTNDIDPEGSGVTVDSFTLPSNGTLLVSANGSFTYTPNAGFIGQDAFTYIATDGALQSNAATATITVTPSFVVVTCQLSPQVYSVGGSATSVDLSKLFSAPAGKTLTYSAVGLPAPWTLNSGTGLLSIVLSGITPGSYIGSLMATEAGGQWASQPATFHVLAANELIHRNGFDLSQNNCP